MDGEVPDRGRLGEISRVLKDWAEEKLRAAVLVFHAGWRRGKVGVLGSTMGWVQRLPAIIAAPCSCNSWLSPT